MTFTMPLPPDARTAVLAEIERSNVMLRYACPPNASGVLVQFAKRFFIFTAAHCLQDESVLFAVPDGRSGVGRGMFARQARGAWVAVDGPDAAVVELAVGPQLDREWLAERAVSEFSLWATLAMDPAFQQRSIPLVVSGLPSASAVESLPGEVHRVGQILEGAHSPQHVDVDIPWRLPLFVSEQVIHLDGAVDEVVDLAGMSGGGCWTFANGRPLLVSAHTGRGRVRHDEHGNRGWLATTTLVTAHLAIIASAIDELRNEVLAAWPATALTPVVARSVPVAELPQQT